MYFLVEILKFSLPAIILAVAFYLIYREKAKKTFGKTASEMQHERQLVYVKAMVPLKIQAYERVVLLLERIAPENLIMRVNRTGMGAMQLKSALTGSIREEFEHNMSQQVYISISSWELVKNAKDEMINLVNTSYAKLPENAGATELIRNIFDAYLRQERSPVSSAIDALKKEMGSNA